MTLVQKRTIADNPKLCFGADEADHSAQSQRWSAHISGDMALMVSREPLSYVRGNSHRVFVDGRLHQVRD